MGKQLIKEQGLTVSMQKSLDDLKNGKSFIRHYGSMEALVRRGLVKKEWRVTETVVLSGRQVEKREVVYSLVQEKENV